MRERTKKRIWMVLAVAVFFSSGAAVGRGLCPPCKAPAAELKLTVDEEGLVVATMPDGSEVPVVRVACAVPAAPATDCLDLEVLFEIAKEGAKAGVQEYVDESCEACSAEEGEGEVDGTATPAGRLIIGAGLPLDGHGGYLASLGGGRELRNGGGWSITLDLTRTDSVDDSVVTSERLLRVGSYEGGSRTLLLRDITTLETLTDNRVFGTFRWAFPVGKTASP